MSVLNEILAEIKRAEVSLDKNKGWNPVHIGKIDIHIDADGRWFHEGRAFQRQSLVKLFSSILQKEKDDYFLITPVEKLRISVEDAPYVATMVEKNQSAIIFTTNLDDKIILDNQHPIRIETDPQSDSPRPYIHFRAGIEALISRTAFYDLICLAEEIRQGDKVQFRVTSLGETFDLGCVNLSEIQ